MPRWRSVDPGARAAPQLLWLTLSLAAFSSGVARDAPAAPASEGFVVEHAALRTEGGTCVVDSRIDFAFSEDNIEAMRNGVPLTIVIDIELRRVRGQWWDETLAARQLRYRIDTNVLTGRYRVRDIGRGGLRNYRSLDKMIEELGHLESVPIIARDRLSADERYAARIRARLDIEALPSPLRPIAYLSPSWRLNSGWFEWQVRQ